MGTLYCGWPRLPVAALLLGAAAAAGAAAVGAAAGLGARGARGAAGFLGLGACECVHVGRCRCVRAQQHAHAEMHPINIDNAQVQVLQLEHHAAIS